MRSEKLFKSYSAIVIFGIVFALEALAQIPYNPEDYQDNINPGVPTPTPVPTPTREPHAPPPPEQACAYYQFIVKYQGNWGEGKGFKAPAVKSSVADCMLEKVRAARKICTATGFSDDCVAGYFGVARASSSLSSLLTTSATKARYKPNKLFNKSTTIAPGFTLYLNGSIYLDSSCNQVSELPPEAILCDAGTFSWLASPVSLIWDSEIDIDSQVTIVDFPINPNEQGKYFLWKATSKTPLLVYDPEHRGAINSGTQLFGNWTFGGKKFVSLSGASTHTLWKNGFEALGTLDLNNDFEISGEELAPLALWFDNNSNGVSELSEVKDIRSMGVSRLFYQPDRHEKATNNIIVTKGFERHENNKIFIGSMVDWHSDSATTREELVAKHFAHDYLCKDRGSHEIQSQDMIHSMSQVIRKAETSSEVQKEPESKNENLSGIWAWEAQDINFPDKKFSPQGLLGFTDDGTGKIVGHSYSQVTLREQIGEVNSIFTIAHLSGHKQTTNGVTSLNFELSGENGANISSTATVYKNSTLIKGTSLATVLYQGKPVTISYKWVAKRFY